MKSYINLIILSLLLTSNYQLFAQYVVPDNAPIVPDTTGMHYFINDKSASTRDYQSIIRTHYWTSLRQGSLSPKDIIELMPSSSDEWIIFYYYMEGDAQDCSPYKRFLQKSYQLLLQYAGSDSNDEYIKVCFFVALSMSRFLPHYLPIEFLMDFDERLNHILVGNGAQRFLCLYSSFSDESLKNSYRDLYNSCLYTRYIDPRNLED